MIVPVILGKEEQDAAVSLERVSEGGREESDGRGGGREDTIEGMILEVVRSDEGRIMGRIGKPPPWIRLGRPPLGPTATAIAAAFSTLDILGEEGRPGTGAEGNQEESYRTRPDGDRITFGLLVFEGR